MHEELISSVKDVIKKHSPPQKILKNDFRALLVKEGMSQAKSYEAIFVLTALDLIKDEKPHLFLDKKLFEGNK
jgi:hypothetical protein